MNPFQSGIPQHYSASINAGQPLEASGSQAQQAQHSHPPMLSLAGMSRNTLDVVVN